MKKLSLWLLVIFLAAPLFSFELSTLEKRIIMAEPEEMLRLVLNRSYEKQMNDTCNRLDDLGFEEDAVMEAFGSAFPGVSENEVLFMIIKLGLVCSFGSGDRDHLYTGIEIVEFCDQLESITDITELPDELQELMKSKYWKDCITFIKLLDLDSFLMERYPEEY